MQFIPELFVGITHQCLYTLPSNSELRNKWLELVYGGTTPGVDEVIIIFFGRTGVGKSSVGNTMLGQETFPAPCSPTPHTPNCKKHEKVINGTKIVVIDTPGINDTSKKEQSEQIDSVFLDCLLECESSPHVVIIVLNVARQTRENHLDMDRLLEYFTGDVVHHLVLLFTHGYDLEENMTIHDFIQKSGTQSLKDLAERCGNRVHVIDNKHWNKNSRDSVVLAALQGLQLSDQTQTEISEKITLTPASETPWFNVLSSQSDSVEEEESEVQSKIEYRTNQYQFTKLMKSIKKILSGTNGQPCKNEALEKLREAVKEEIKNILHEMNKEEKTGDMEEIDQGKIRRRAIQRVRTKKWRKLAGITTGVFFGLLFVLGAPPVIAASLIRAGWKMLTRDKKTCENVVGMGVVAVALYAGVKCLPFFLLCGAGIGFAAGHHVSNMSDNPNQAFYNVCKLSRKIAQDFKKKYWNLASTATEPETKQQLDQDK